MKPAPPVTIARTASYPRALACSSPSKASTAPASRRRRSCSPRRSARRAARSSLTREPGGTELGERIRELLLGTAARSRPWAEAALFAAARAQLVEQVIAPAIERGADVVCDRYLDSSLAYQGIARDLGLERVLELNLLAVRGLLPDRTFLLLLPPADAAARCSEEPDRIEREGAVFAEEVDRAYREIARVFAQRVVVVDGTLNPEDIAEIVRGQLRDLP